MAHSRSPKTNDGRAIRAESRQAEAQGCCQLEASGSERACRQPGAVGKRLLHPCLFRDEEQAVLRVGDRRMTTDTKLDSLGILSMRSTGASDGRHHHGVDRKSGGMGKSE